MVDGLTIPGGVITSSSSFVVTVSFEPGGANRWGEPGAPSIQPLGGPDHLGVDPDHDPGAESGGVERVEAIPVCFGTGCEQSLWERHESIQGSKTL